MAQASDDLEWQQQSPTGMSTYAVPSTAVATTDHTSAGIPGADGTPVLASVQTPGADGAAFVVPSEGVPRAIVTPSGKPYTVDHLFEDAQAQSASAWFTADPLRTSMGNRKNRFWPKVFGGILVAVGFVHFFVFLLPLLAVLGGSDEGGMCGVWCEIVNDAAGNITYSMCDDTSGNASISQAASPCLADDSSLPLRGRWQRMTPAGTLLVIIMLLLSVWTCCWGGAFLPATGYVFIRPDEPRPAKCARCRTENEAHPCGPLRGPTTSRYLFSAVSLVHGISEVVVIMLFLAGTTGTNVPRNMLDSDNILVVLVHLVATVAYFVAVPMFTPRLFRLDMTAPVSKRDTAPSLGGFVRAAGANVIANYSLINYATGEAGVGQLLVATWPPVLLFFAMFMYFGASRAFVARVLAPCVVVADKRKYDKLWSNERQALDQEPAARLQGRSLAFCRPPGRMFYIADESLKSSKSELLQPFGGSVHPHHRLVALFHFASAADKAFQQCVSEWSNAIVGETHAKHSPVKSPERTVQKLQRSYGLENALRVLDLVRATIVCQDLHLVSQVVDIVRADPRVRILREKNRFAPNFDAPTGYRNFQMVMQMLDPGTAGFICELQIDLQSMHDEKNRPGSSGHANYKKWRNYKGQ